MRQITIAEFRANLAAELKNPPFTIVRHKKPIAYVVKEIGSQKPTTPKPPKEVKASPPPSLKMCPHGIIMGIGVCKYGCV